LVVIGPHSGRADRSFRLRRRSFEVVTANAVRLVSEFETAYAGAVNNRANPPREAMVDHFAFVNSPFKNSPIKDSGH
jgi:hypothetical protein